MIKDILLLFSILICLIACDTHGLKDKTTHDIKIEHFKTVIKSSGFIKLPLIFDANIENSLKTNYKVDLKGKDSLIFDSDIRSIIGFLPDTTEYYAILFYTAGDMLYPTIMTFDKKGNRIDRQIINAAGCAGHAALDVISCYDSVWISSELNIKSVSRVIGTVETEDSIPKTLNICNIRKVEGLIEKSGKIVLKNSDLIDCNDE